MLVVNEDSFWPFEVSDGAKARAFDNLLSHYFNANFGTLSKVEYELMLFAFYYDQCQAAQRCDGSDYTSDYVLSKRLGITQARVRSLKLRSSLKEPETDDAWIELLVQSIENAQYDESCGLVKMTVSDVTVLVELRHLVEMLGWYDEYQLNPKLFQCPLRCFIAVCNEICKPNEPLLDDQAIERLKKERARIEKEAGSDTASKEREGLLKFIDVLVGGANVTDKVKDYIPSAELRTILGLFGKAGIVCQAVHAFAQKL